MVFQLHRSSGPRTLLVVTALAGLGAPAVVSGSSPSVQPDITRFVYAAPDRTLATQIRLVGSDGSDSRPLLTTDPGGKTHHPFWSPDGTRIAFDVYLPGDPSAIEIWVADADGSDAARLAACELPCLQLAYPTWSPDGTQLALMRYDLTPEGEWGPSVLEVLDLADGSRRVVAETVDGLSAYYEPTWSPDGVSIAVAVETYTDISQVALTGRAVAVVDAAGGSPRIVTSPDVAAWQPDWGPSERIAFVVQDSLDAPPTAARVMTMAPDGSDLRDASAPGLPFAFDPVWMPDGVTLSMTTADDERGPQWLAFLDATGQLTEVEWSIDRVPGLQRLYPRPRPG
jgi:Tol biopolymer transport system component